MSLVCTLVAGHKSFDFDRVKCVRGSSGTNMGIRVERLISPKRVRVDKERGWDANKKSVKCKVQYASGLQKSSWSKVGTLLEREGK